MFKYYSKFANAVVKSFDYTEDIKPAAALDKTRQVEEGLDFTFQE